MNINNINIGLVTDVANHPSLVQLFLELRPQYDEKQLLARIERQQQQGYQMVVADIEGHAVAVAGFVIGEKLAWGKHLYVDDLATGSQWRSYGIGKRLIQWLKQHAKEQQCEQFHLDSGVQRFRAHRFYLNNRFNIASHHFSITDL